MCFLLIKFFAIYPLNARQCLNLSFKNKTLPSLGIILVDLFKASAKKAGVTEREKGSPS